MLKRKTWSNTDLTHWPVTRPDLVKIADPRWPCSNPVTRDPVPSLQYDLYVLLQHGLPREDKWRRCVALFEQSWISWFRKMSVLSLSYWESNVTVQTFRIACPTSWRKNSWHRYGMKKLRHCHPICITLHKTQETAHRNGWTGYQVASINQTAFDVFSYET